MAGWWGGCVPHFWLAVKTLWTVLNLTVIFSGINIDDIKPANGNISFICTFCTFQASLHLCLGSSLKLLHPKGSKICLRRTRIQRKGIGVAFWWQHSLTGVCLPLACAGQHGGCVWLAGASRRGFYSTGTLLSDLFNADLSPEKHWGDQDVRRWWKMEMTLMLHCCYPQNS